MPRDDAGMRGGRVVIFALHHMHRRVGEILQPAGMIEVEMGQNDMPYVAGVMAQRLDLADRGLLLTQTDVQHRAPRQGDAGIGTSMRVRDVLQAITGVDQHQPVVIGFDQQAMAHQMPQQPMAASVEQRAAQGAVGPAIEMMDTHATPTGRKRPSS